MRREATASRRCSDALEALDALSVSVEDADAQTDAEQALFGEPGMPPPKDGWQRSRVMALFADRGAAREAPRCCRRRTSSPAARCSACADVPEQDWVRLTQSQFAPVRDHARVLDRADLARAAGRRRAQVIRLDPGLAFGTGTHPTTRMCLRWIARARAPRGPARARLRLRLGHPGHRRGASSARADIDAVDIDPAAVRVHAANAQANGVHAAAPACPTRRRAATTTVLANILATPLKVLAPLLCAHVAPGGRLVLAGILERQADELKQAYAPYAQLRSERQRRRLDPDDGAPLSRRLRGAPTYNPTRS